MPEIKLTTNQVMNAFVDKMIAEKGAPADEDDQRKLRDSLKGQLNEKIDQAMLAALPEDEFVELERLADNNATDEELDAFFARSKVEFEPVIAQVMTEFRKTFLGIDGEEK